MISQCPLFLVATAVMLVGGLVVIIVLQQAAFADPGGQTKVTTCHIPPGNPDNRHEVTTGALSLQHI
jgi:hypothetical protein